MVLKISILRLKNVNNSDVCFQCLILTETSRNVCGQVFPEGSLFSQNMSPLPSILDTPFLFFTLFVLFFSRLALSLHCYIKGNIFKRMYYVSKRMEIAGCHRLTLSYDSKCRNMHGHNWIVTVHCKAKELNADGMVIDFKRIKDEIHGFLDHGNFNELLPFNPTAENIARWICERVEHCWRVDIEESRNNMVTYIKDED